MSTADTAPAQLAPEPEDVGPAAPDDVKPIRSRAPRARKPRADKAPRARGAVAQNQRKRVADSVQGLHELAGGLALPLIGLPITGQVLAASGADAGQLWADVAARYPAVARLFTGTADGVVFVKLAMLYAPIIMAASNERAGTSSGAPDPGDLLASMFATPPTPATPADPMAAEPAA